MSGATIKIVRLLGQDRVWRDGNGVTHELETMDRHHRANLIPLLRRNAHRLQREAVRMHFHGMGLAGDDVSDGVWNAQAMIEAELELPAEDWLERQALMRKLTELEAGRSIDERAATAARNKLYETTRPYRKVGS